jgi:DHA3 family macrolide efflux protein-like MFS transporter
MYRRLFQNRNFTALWIGQMISFIGDYFNMLAIPIMVNRLTGSAMMVGLSVMASALPALILGPIAGVFVDRWDRRRVMIFSDVLRALLVLCLLTVRSVEQVWVFYVIGFLISCTSQFFFPARGAVLPLIVTDPQDWLAANGLMQIIQTVGLLAGPAMAGFAIGLWGEQVAFIANSAGYLASAAAVFTMHVPRTTPGTARGNFAFKDVFQDLREGLVYLFTHRSTIGVLVCLTVAMLGVGAINVIWVPYLQRTFGIGAEGLGIVDAAQGAGMLVGGLLLGIIARRIRKSVLSGAGLLLIGVLFALMGFSPLFFMIIVESFLVGLALVPVQSALATIMQVSVPDLKRGRVGSSMGAIQTSGSLLSMAFASFFGEQIGLNNVYLIIGAFIFLSGILGFWLLQEIPAPSPDMVQPIPDKSRLV